jgi:transcriptional regulator with XRE-family HTH domain
LRIVQEGNPESVFAARLRQAREAAGMTQPQLADRLYEASGIRLDPSAITRIERGKRTIRLNEAAHLAVILDIRIGDLMLLPPWSAGLHPQDQEAQRRALNGELARLDAEIARAVADAAQAGNRAAELAERRKDIAMQLAMLASKPAAGTGDSDEPR